MISNFFTRLHLFLVNLHEIAGCHAHLCEYIFTVSVQ